jgi:hypothetical protein
MHAVICSTSGTNSRQNFIASERHARSCSSVPAEKPGVAEEQTEMNAAIPTKRKLFIVIDIPLCPFSATAGSNRLLNVGAKVSFIPY